MIRPERFDLFYMGRCPICLLQNISLIRLVVLEKKIFEYSLKAIQLKKAIKSRVIHSSVPCNVPSLPSCDTIRDYAVFHMTAHGIYEDSAHDL